jgi:hypothetical protein
MSTKLKLKKSLLASTCLTAITLSGANAAIVNESSVPSGDFSNFLNLSTTQLAAGTTQVNGAIVGNGDHSDFFYIPGFTPGSSVTLTMSGTGATDSFQVYTGLDADSPSATTIYNGEGAVVSVTSSGLLAFGRNTEGSPGTYSVFISAPPTSVPVAPTAALLGVGVAAVGLRRRKHGVAK